MNVAATLGFSLVCWGVFLYLFHKDRSRYRNCYVLTFAILSLFPLIICISGNNWQEPMIVIIMAFLLSILIVPFFLIYNGFVMMRKEGRHLSQLLSLGLGIAILAGEAILAAGVLYYAYVGNKTPFLIQRTIWPVLGAVFCMTVIYGSVSFLIFMIYTLFLQIIPRKKDFDYVIIHGSGLLEGDRVPKLLQDRLDKAIEVYRQDPTPPKLIPSGGQGSDESIPEAEAMKRYLLSKGIPEEDILPEERSTTTLENLRYSQEIINSFPGRKYTALVSSNYHVYRALRYCREIRLKCTGIGSHVTFYYWPNAMIREYIAIHAEKKHLILFVLGWLCCLALLLAMIYI
ncbi:DUF218 domain-containing protein [Aristaeella hokkaidonensis]|nr:DUF218 domain-containing protein [Aristaeella hokkaidonensis]